MENIAVVTAILPHASLPYPPEFLKGSAPAHVRNRHRRYHLYHLFWTLLKELGLWEDNMYLEMKRTVTHPDDQWDIIPPCIV